jgi:putative nucleotidyltransferase with HDIG domain
MQIPTLKQAQTYLDEAGQRNPGRWIDHSIYVAKAAQSIAGAHPDLNPDVAFILGYLHDIGRREGVTHMRHIIDGYTFLHHEGFEDAARICLTHSFPIKHIEMVAAEWDCSADEIQFVDSYVQNVEYTPYDRLIQLCDALALPSGFCLIEKRLLDVALRYGVNQHSVARWQSYLALQAEFDRAIGQSIYQVLDGVVENTFGFAQ